MAGRRHTVDGAAARAAGIRQDGTHLIVPVRVTPRARRNTLALEGDTLHVRLAAPPVEGAANAALLALLAERLGLPKRAVTLLRGETSREKVVAIEGITAEAFRQHITSSS